MHFLRSPLHCDRGVSPLFLAANLLPQSVPFTLHDPFQLIRCPRRMRGGKEGEGGGGKREREREKKRGDLFP